MNDPGLHDPIDRNAARVEQEIEAEDEKLDREDEQLFLNPRFAFSINWRRETF